MDAEWRVALSGAVAVRSAVRALVWIALWDRFVLFLRFTALEFCSLFGMPFWKFLNSLDTISMEFLAGDLDLSTDFALLEV